MYTFSNSIKISDEKVIVTILAYESLKKMIENIMITEPYSKLNIFMELT